MTHEQIKPFLGKNVKITFLDNDSRTGTLDTTTLYPMITLYILKERMLLFSATVIKKIEVLK